MVTGLLACSGPGAMAVIERNERHGWIMFAIAVGILVVLAALPEMRRRGLRSLWPVLVLLVVHPGLWMSARFGDCGRLLWFASTAATIAMPALAALSYLLVRRRRRIAEDPTQY